MIILTVVLVIYNENITKTSSYNSFINCFEKFPYYNTFVNLIIYDNSLEPQYCPKSNIKNVTYFHDKNNSGVCGAYNFALSMANNYSSKWMLLLDQDTIFDYFFLQNLLNDISSTKPEIVCIIPTAYNAEKTIISPYISKLGGRYTPLNFLNDYNKNIYAINSGSTIRVNFLNEISGFNKLFWLDQLDHWLFKTISIRNKEIYISKNIIYHNISIFNLKNISLFRYSNMLDAEILFNKEYTSVKSYMFFKFLLLFRVFKFLFFKKRPDLAKYTFLKFLNFE